MGAKTVYLDNCCNSRLFDDNTQPKVLAQATAIRRIIRNRQKDGYNIIGSFVCEYEIGKIPDDELRLRAKEQYDASIDGTVDISAQIIARAHILESMGLDKFDATHLAVAEAAGADVLITTDEKFIRRCERRNITAVKVINPLDF